jgi:hypothetical protein
MASSPSPTTLGARRRELTSQHDRGRLESNGLNDKPDHELLGTLCKGKTPG